MPPRESDGLANAYLNNLAAAPLERPAWLLGEWPGPTLRRLEELRTEFEQLRKMHEALGVAVQQFGDALGLAVALEENGSDAT